MPQFILLCRDKPDSRTLRMETRATHLEYAQSLGSKLHLAGPMLDDSNKPIGSLIIVEADDEPHAREIADNDPYNKAGLFLEVGIIPFLSVIENFPKEKA